MNRDSTTFGPFPLAAVVERLQTDTLKDSDADRWRNNRPTGIAPPGLHVWGACVLWAVLVLLLVGGLLCTVATAADAAEPPELILFSASWCTYCDILEKEFGDLGRLATYRDRYRLRVVKLDQRTAATNAIEAAYLQAVPARAQWIDIDGPGVRQIRPPGNLGSVPVLWIRGRNDYWSGYSRGTLPDLDRYLDAALPTPPPVDNQTGTVPGLFSGELQLGELRIGGGVELGPPTATPPATDRSQIENVAIPAASPPPANQDEPNIAPPVEDFSGLTVVVLVPALTDGAVELRAELARRANNALQGLIRERIGERVDAYLISEVGDPDTFARLVATVGVRPGLDGSPPVAALVLIPERLQGLQGFIVERIERALAAHYLPTLKRAGLFPIVERIHGDTYSAVLAALTTAGGGTLPTNQPLIYLISTYIAERSKLGAWLLAKFKNRGTV